MDAAIKEQWIKDLLSGEFEQGPGVLEKDGQFCCLGVLCYRAAEAGVVERHTSTIGLGFWYGDTQTILPDEVIQWAGLSDELHDPDAKRGHYVDGDNEDHWLTVDNDTNGHDFPTIAETVRKYF